MFIDSLLSDSLESYCPSLLLQFKDFELYWGAVFTHFHDF